MEVGSCFRDYDDFKESFSSFKKETKCQYGLRNSVSVRYYNRKNATNIRDSITFTHVKFDCVEPLSHNKKKKQISAGCPAYLILEYSEELDRLVVTEQNSNHIHVGLRDSQTRTSTPPVVQETAPGNATSPPQKVSRKRLQQKKLDSLVIKERNSNHNHNGPRDSQIETSTSPLWETAPTSATSPPQLHRKRPKQELPEDSLVIKERKTNHTHDSQRESQIGNGIPSPVRETTPEPSPSPPQKLLRKRLQQESPWDSLVIKEHNHIRDSQRDSHIENGTPSVVRETTPGPDTSPPQKLHRKRLRQKRSVEATCNGKAMEKLPSGCPTSPIETNTISLTSRETVSGTALERVVEAMKDFLRDNVGSMGSFSIDSTQELERLNFQTSKMRAFFTKFPESLLLHRVQSKCAYVLYAFFVESKERVSKVVHFAVLKEDTLENVAKMLSVFQQFNPECQKVKVVFTDTSFLHKLALKESFPTAQVLLSVYHTVRLIEKKAKERSALKDYLELALRDVVFSTSSENLKQLSRMLKKVLDPEFHEFLQTHWFSCEMLWYMHVKKGLHSCSTYMDTLEMIIHNISSLFKKKQSLEFSILYFVECADYFNSKGLENPNLGFAYSTKVIPRKAVKKTKASTSSISSPPLPVLLPKDKVALSRPVLLPKDKLAVLAKLAQITSKEVLPVKLAQIASEEVLPVKLAQIACEEVLPVKQEQIAPEEVDIKQEQISPEEVDVKQEQIAPEEVLDVKLEQIASEEVLPDKLEQTASEEVLPVKLEQTASEEVLPVDLPHNAFEEVLPVALPQNASMEVLPVKPPQNASKDILPVKLLQNASKEEDHMLVALQTLCTELAYHLCLSEWEVVKKSTQIIKVFNTSISVKLLEATHQVSKDCQSCSCYFNSRYRLPCRHILTILHTNKQPVEDTMVCHRWQRKYQQPSLTEEDLLGRVRYSAQSQDAGDERFAKMKSLSKELSNLLLQCEGAELKERCSTLQMIVDIWKKPEKQSEDVNLGTVENLGELPPLWVKQELSDMEHLNVS